MEPVRYVNRNSCLGNSHSFQLQVHVRVQGKRVQGLHLHLHLPPLYISPLREAVSRCCPLPRTTIPECIKRGEEGEESEIPLLPAAADLRSSSSFNLPLSVATEFQCNESMRRQTSMQARGVIEGTKPMKNFCSGILVI